MSAQYARRLLQMREDSDTISAAKLANLPEALAGRYPAHGFVISRDEARSLGLPVVDLEQYEYCEVVTQIAQSLEDQRVNVVRRMTPDQLTVVKAQEEQSE